MTREILCEKCGSGHLPVFAGEHERSKFGKALENFLCDICATTIPRGTSCYARSIWADGHGMPYYRWEEEYITV